jgi:hypothetical protein
MGGAAISAGIQAGVTMLGNVASAAGEAAEQRQASEQAHRNAILSEYAAKDAEQRGAAEAATITSKGTQTIASARVATAASGIELDSPTALNVASTTAANTKLDALTTTANAAREAWGYRQQGAQYTTQSEQAAAKSHITPLSIFTGRSG